MSIKRLDGSIIIDAPHLNTKEAAESCAKNNISLSEADLSGANLSGANLRDADLRGACLRDADLRGARLLRANLSDVNLSYADLGYSILTHANLSGANLSGAIGDGLVVRTMQMRSYVINIIDDMLFIGCVSMRIHEWANITPSELLDIYEGYPENAVLDFQKYMPIIFAWAGWNEDCEPI